MNHVLINDTLIIEDWCRLRDNNPTFDEKMKTMGSSTSIVDEPFFYEDNKGKIWMPEEIEGFPIWEIETMGIHVAENKKTFESGGKMIKNLREPCQEGILNMAI